MLIAYFSSARAWSKALQTPMKAPKRHIYAHDTLDDAYIDGEQFEDASQYGIDYPLDLIEVNATNFNCGLRLSYKQWKRLPEDAKKIWNMLSQEAKAIILNYKLPENTN